VKRCVKITDIKAIEVLDSRGNPTVLVDVFLEDGNIGEALVPSGASTGSFEAKELRDNDIKRYKGYGVKKAVNNINEIICKSLKGENVFQQLKIDTKLVNLDGTDNKSKLGANAILAVSLAVARAAACSLGIELYQYLGGINAKKLPMPMMNILNGGKHSDNNVNIQEFMIVPVGATSFEQCMEMGTNVYKSLKEILKNKGYVTSVGDEGGFAPNLVNDEEALELIVEAIQKSGYKIKEDIAIALDIASTEMYEEAKKIGKNGYYFWKNDLFRNSDEMIDYLNNLVKKYPIISIEDGLAEEDWDSWKKLTQLLGKNIQLVGDDLFVTNLNRLQKGVNKGVGNSILIKLNQIGTLTETLQTIEYARSKGYGVIVSHRSGETEDTFIADLAVAVNCGQIKTGAPCRTDRVAKYNKLLKIESQLGIY